MGVARSSANFYFSEIRVASGGSGVATGNALGDGVDHLGTEVIVRRAVGVARGSKILQFL